MQSKMTTLLPVLLLLSVAAVHACVPATCPSPYLRCGWDGACPVCCLPLATCASPPAMRGIPAPPPLPSCCGGPGPACPLSVSCASSFSQVVAGSNGCSTAASRIAGTSISVSTSVFTSIFKYKIKDFCDAVTASNVCNVQLTDYSPPTDVNNVLLKYVAAAASAYASAFTGVLANWDQFACECGTCTTNACSSAQTKVAGQFAAVATAQAAAFAGAWSQINVCGKDAYGNDVQMPILAESWSTSLAAATAQAAINVWDKLKTTPSATCRYTYGSDAQAAIAKATACAFASAFSSILTAAYPMDAVTSQCLQVASTNVCAATQATGFGCVLGQPCTVPWGATCDWCYLTACA